MTAWLAVALLVAQVELNPPKDGSVISVDVDLVNVLCAARDSHGGYIPDLKKEDFQIKEDGRERPITHFAREVDSPLTIALLLDVSGSVRMVVDEEKGAASAFFQQVLRPKDQAMLVGFAQLISVVRELTPSAADLQAALDQVDAYTVPSSEMLAARPRGGTLLYDAVNLVAKRKLQRIAGRKAMILVTDGMDNGSLASNTEAIRAAQAADTAVYVIHYADQRGMGAMEKITSATGGRIFDVRGKTKLAEVFDQIAEEMRHQYGVGFTPAQADGLFHKIEVRCLRPGVKIQARNGYVAARH